MIDPYDGREQTKAKHFILRRYLQALAFKVLRFSDITYIDGFSGPWESKAEDFSDSSFMIAISVLRDAKKILEERKISRRIRCFFSETNPDAFAQLKGAVAPIHRPDQGFEIQTYNGKFEDAVGQAQLFIGNSFPLIFIDPTGWTGYSFEKIKPLLESRKSEVLINFMYEFINRFVYSDSDEIVASLDPILGGPGWRNRIDTTLPRGLAVERLFRETLKSAGRFRFVVSTRIEKATAERPHFFITYGTKSPDGLIAFRQTEFEALREHEKNRANAKEKMRQAKSRTVDLFAGHQAQLQEATIVEIVKEQKAQATEYLLQSLATNGACTFDEVVVLLLQIYMLRETNVRDLCVELAKANKIENTWGGGGRKPDKNDVIRLKKTSKVV